MITFDKLNRRAHLYLGLFLMPWLLMYGLSSFIVIHHTWFPTDRPGRELLLETAYSRPVNLQGANNSPELRAAAQGFSRSPIWTARSGRTNQILTRCTSSASVFATQSASSTLQKTKS